jgi:molybdenum cofactor guanylyltransferase
MIIQRNPAAGFVLVGGQSRRMGRDKALLEFDGRVLFLRVANILKPYTREVTLLGSAARYTGFGLPVLEDQHPGKGPLGALYTGLRNSSCEWNLFFACDLPFLNHRLIEMLLERTSDTIAQAIVPEAGDRWQPLCAAYHRSCLASIEAMLHQNENLSLVGLLSLVRVEVLTPGPSESPRAWEKMFLNVNTPAQWEQVQCAESAVAR